MDRGMHISEGPFLFVCWSSFKTNQGLEFDHSDLSTFFYIVVGCLAWSTGLSISPFRLQIEWPSFKQLKKKWSLSRVRSIRLPPPYVSRSIPSMPTLFRWSFGILNWKCRVWGNFVAHNFEAIFLTKKGKVWATLCLSPLAHIWCPFNSHNGGHNFAPIRKSQGTS